MSEAEYERDGPTEITMDLETYTKDIEAARQEGIEQAAKVAESYWQRMETAKGKPHPISGQPNRIAECKADAAATILGSIRTLKDGNEGKG